MVEKIAFQSLGGVKGIYLPSEEEPKYGSLLTDYGIFPAEVSKQVRRTYQRFAGHPISELKEKKKLRFLTWVLGIEDPPYYKLDLRSIHEEFSEWGKQDNWFYLQGIVAERTPDKVVLRMQQNYWLDYSEEKIEASINYIPIKNCPNNVRKSQFWKFTASFRDGFLHCKTAERLADAKETKKVLKSWLTDPIDSSHSKELLRN